MHIGRWLRHAFTTPNAVRRAFGPATLHRIEQAIAASETRHSGEIRFAVEATLPWSYLLRDAPARERADMVFAKLRVWDTEQNNGVLIYVELADHRIEIVADRAIARHVAPVDWQAICDAMRAEFRAGRFEAGTVAGIEAVGALLTEHFPIAEGEDNADQLPNAPQLL
jgi:uncharacterized membrane protein